MTSPTKSIPLHNNTSNNKTATSTQTSAPINMTFNTFKDDAWSFAQIALEIILVIVIASFLIKVGKKLIVSFFEKQKELTKVPITDKRADTLKTISVSVFKYIIYFIVATIILSFFSINVSSILAVAGIGGVAIGFGAQSLVKDIISGFFILLEDQYAVGDSVTINNLTGNVRGIELRTTKINGANGDIYIIPNGQITIITNHSRSAKTIFIDLSIAYSENAENVLEKLDTMCNKIYKDNADTFNEPPIVLGINEFRENLFIIRISASTLPEHQAEAGRIIRLESKNLFEAENIKSFDSPIINKLK